MGCSFKKKLEFGSDATLRVLESYGVDDRTIKDLLGCFMVSYFLGVVCLIDALIGNMYKPV